MRVKSETYSEDVPRHYNHPVEYYWLELGEGMPYSNGIWTRGAKTPLECTNDKLDWWFEDVVPLKKGMKVGETGPGWGYAGHYITEKFGVEYTGFNISKVQTEYAKEKYGLNYIHCDLFDVAKKFPKYLEYFDLLFDDGVLIHQKDCQLEFFKAKKRLLKPRGTMLSKELHIIPGNEKIVGERCKDINADFDSTGQYRIIKKDLEDLESLDMETDVYDMDVVAYGKMMDIWIDNLSKHKEQMVAIAGLDKWELDMVAWLKHKRNFYEKLLTCDVMVSKNA